MSKLSVQRVAVLVETSNVYGREIQLGIADFVRRNARWSIFAEQHELGALPPPWLLRQQWDGIISRPTTVALAKVFAKMGVPVVDLNDQLLDLGYPQLLSDNEAIGQMAAEHLRERGFVHFGYCGFAGEPWAAERRDGFAEAIAARGFAVDVYETYWRGRRILSWENEQRGLEKWVRSLPQPVAVFACNDVRGRHVLEVCRRLGVPVPERFAVVGVDNDELLCRMSDPPLSSVVPDAYRIGYQAAELLHKLMRGHKWSSSAQRLPPREVVTRQSTDVQAVNDPAIADAVRFIHEHACEGIRVSDVLRTVPMSRSLLERRFRQSVGARPMWRFDWFSCARPPRC
ncbi:MAG: substrate-binding domain-containing protein [Tepidisphaeraceae bacterium]